MPAHIVIVRNPLQRLVRLADQSFFFRRRVRDVRLLRQIRLNCAQPPRVLRHQPVHLIQKSRRAFNRLFAPLQILFRRRREQGVHPPRIRAIFVRHIDRAHHIPARFRHRHPAFLHHALGEQPRNRLVVLHQSQIAHHLAEKSRIQQMQNRVRDPAHILIDRKPVFRLGLIEQRLVVVRVGIPVEIPARIDERIHRVRLAPRRPAAFRAGRIHELRRTRQRRFAFAGQLHIFRQFHRQLIVRHRHDSILLAIHNRNRRAPIPLARNAPILQSISRLARAKSFRRRIGRHFLDRRVRCQPRVRPGIHQPPVGRKRFAHPIDPQRRPVERLHHNLQRQMIFFGELIIPLVMRRHAHQRAGPVFRQHKIRHPNRNLRARIRIHRKPPGEKSLFLRRRNIRRAHALLPQRLQL